MKKKLENSLAWVRERIETMTKTANGLSGDDRTTVENTIAKLREQEEVLVNAIEMCNNNADLASLRTQIDEVQNSVKAIRDTMKIAKKTANSLKDISKTKAFRDAFVETVKNTVEPREFKAAWRKKVNELMVQNSINSDNISAGDFLPGFIINEISDRFIGKRHRLLELVDWTGLPMWKSLFETSEEMGDTHVIGTEKAEQRLAFADITIRPAYVYKLQRVDQVLLRETRDMDDVLYRYIITELLDRVLKTTEDYIVTGHGTDHFIKAQQVVVAQTAGGDDIMDAGYYLEDSDGAIAIMSKQKYYEIKTSLSTLLNQGGRLATHDDVLAYLGVDEIIFNSSIYVPSAGYTWNGILFMKPDDYKLVGDRKPDQYEDFNLGFNKREYLMEIYIGGGCVKPNQFVALVTRE